MSELPATIGVKFAVTRRLGKGGMGTVFEAIDQGTNERVAVKVIAANMADDPSLVSRFQREVRTASSLDTPHIVRIIEAGVDPVTELPFMAMEYLEGEDLRQLIKRLGPLPPDLALRIAAQACKALQAAHDAKILHRDIKPANLFLTKQDGKRIVKLLDFGVAKVQQGELTGDAEMTGLTRTGSMIGSPLYMSPEQAKGYRDIDERSDLWSLGVVIYQMLCGRTPHAKIDQLGELLVRICTIAPPPIQRRAPWVPPAIVGVLAHLLAMEADDRFPNATTVLDALQMLLSNGDEIPEESLRPLSAAEKSIVADSTMVTVAGPSGAVPGFDPMGHSGMSRSSMGFSQSAPAVFTAPGGQRDSGMIQGDATSDSPSHPGTASQSGVDPSGPHLRTSTLTSGATSMTGTSPMMVAPERKNWKIAVVGLTAGILAAVVYFGLFAKPPASSGAASASSSQAEPKSKTVKLFVLPKDATVEISGTKADVTDGFVELDGSLGSVHKVRVTAGGVSKSFEVAVTDSGAVPAKVEVEAQSAQAATASAESSSSATAEATSTPHTAVGAGSWHTKPKPTATSTPTATQAQTGRTLRDDR